MGAEIIEDQKVLFRCILDERLEKRAPQEGQTVAPAVPRRLLRQPSRSYFQP